ncbi:MULTISPECIES: M56 family metallopeptidase [unclassified Breznakia]|uniref:M56 family metallopeptidase n=1 Tax=unclassified Breznakia TaxID=2623764 RepID=UPI002406E220|nr:MULTISPECIES: M56 family metallopeptidase [unclassified Breznakia]MDF9838169.1 beta-lactamase regulating signal transducer with metallopeptidase domain [Breznakia sp. PFB2-8]MDF9860155.1 beta-lactamase regulating signal transducer with metallopeptidase domain [Breznakia sp. PH5-24]
MNLLEISLSTILLIIIVIVIRSLAIYRVSKRVFVFLWSLIVLRLITPFSIPESWNVFQQINTLQSKEIPHVVNVIRDGGNKVVSQTKLPIGNIEILYFLGVILILSYFITMYYHSHKKFTKLLPIENTYITTWKRTHALRRNISVKEAEKITSPLTYGIFKPVILLPKGFDWQNLDHVDYVFEHEFNHIKNFDVLKKLFLNIVVCIHWFNPFVWILYVLANRDIELACDERVVYKFGKNKKSEYATALLDIEEDRGLMNAFYSSFARNSIEERIVLIMKAKKNSIVVAVFASTILIGGLIYISSPLAIKATESDPVKLTDTQALENGADFHKEDMSYDEFKAWSDKQLEQTQKLVDSGKVSKETMELERKDYENTLEEIKNGAKVSVSEYGDGEVVISSGNDEQYDAEINRNKDEITVNVKEKK